MDQTSAADGQTTQLAWHRAAVKCIMNLQPVTRRKQYLDLIWPQMWVKKSFSWHCSSRNEPHLNDLRIVDYKQRRCCPSSPPDVSKEQPPRGHTQYISTRTWPPHVDNNSSPYRTVKCCARGSKGIGRPPLQQWAGQYWCKSLLCEVGLGFPEAGGRIVRLGPEGEVQTGHVLGNRQRPGAQGGRLAFCSDVR